MKLDSILGSAPERRLLPVEELHRPTVAVMAIMTFAMVVIAAAALALSNAAGSIVSSTANRAVIVVPGAVASALPDAVAAARSARGVKSVSAVPESEMRRSLERWLGEAASSSDLPVPALATAELDRSADVSQLAAAVRARVPQATISTETEQLAPMVRSLRALQWLALALVAMIAVATAAAIVLAARGALDTHRSTVEIMHGIGATDDQLTRLFQRKIAADAIAGAAAGAACGAILLLLVGGTLAAASADFAADVPFGWRSIALLATVPVIAVLIAIGVARSTLLRALRETL